MEKRFEEVYVKEERIDPNDSSTETSLNSEDEDEVSTSKMDPNSLEEETPSTSAQSSVARCSGYSGGSLERRFAEAENSGDETDNADNLIVPDSDGFNKEIPQDSNTEQETIEVLVTPVLHQSRKRTQTITVKGNLRKRKKNTPERERRKMLKNSGQPYISSRGKFMEGAKMGPPCACSWDCVHKVSEEKRTRVFKSFWHLGNHELQWEYIRNHSECSATTEGHKKRGVSRKYFFRIDGEEIRICKTMFRSTLGICDSWIVSAHSHVKDGTVAPSKRGRHGNHHVQYTDEKIDTIIEHVNTFPRVPSHLCRRRSRKEYLESGLSLAKMAKLYSEWAVKKNLPRKSIATARQYCDITNLHFNLGFFKSKKCRCRLCVIITNKKTPPALRDAYKATYDAHIANKDTVRTLKERDKKDGTKDPKVMVICFDLEKQLPCPKSEASQYYYKNKLSVFNFTVFDMVHRMGTCYLWHEGEGRKGSNELASVLFYHISKCYREGYTDFRLWSDNNSGQNKNRALFAMYAFAASVYDISIIHRYLEPGHAATECEAIHVRIESAAKGKELFHFDEWFRLIESVKDVSPMFQVARIETPNLLCFKGLVEGQNWAEDVAGDPIKWTKVREITVTGKEDGILRLRTNFEHPYTTLNIHLHDNIIDLREYRPPLAYKSTIPLSARIREDLQSVCDAVPECYHDFYQGVINGTCDADDQYSEKDFESDEELCEGEEFEEVLGELDGLGVLEENQEEENRMQELENVT